MEARRVSRSRRRRPESRSRYRLTIIREEDASYEVLESVKSPAAMAKLLHELLGFPHQEVAGVLLFDSRNRVIGHVITHLGTLRGASVEPRDVFLPALLANAAGLAFFHTHPSGDPTPSVPDISFSRQLSEAAELLRVTLVDSLVLGEPPTFVSLRAENRLGG